NEAIQQLDKVTQQNAGASEAMSSTSEQLSAQAEEMLESISFFRIAQSTAGRPHQASKQHRSAGFAGRQGTSPSAKSAKSASGMTVAAQQARVNGFKLDMSMGGPDEADHEFREIA
ncbi:chemotaxis protein, partial [Rhizobium sp. AAP43]